jgi:hypothetical protein
MAAQDHDAVPAPQDDDAVPVEGWIGREEVAARFKVAPRTISRWIDRGMPCGGPPGAIRFMLTECEAWLGKAAGPDEREVPAEREARPTSPMRVSSQSRARVSQPCERPSDATNGAPLHTEPSAGRTTADAPAAVPVVAAVEPWVGVAAAAAHLACTEAHIEALSQRDDERRIPYRRESGRLLFKLSQIDVWLERTSAILE